MDETTRREFLKKVSAATGAVALAPLTVACGSSQGDKRAAHPEVLTKDPLYVPLARPSDWNAIDFNRKRGNAGAIPERYRPEINGPESAKEHIGKHLPYVPSLNADVVPAGHIALMWGDAEKGYARHPNAQPNSGNDYEGHWYNWIRIRKAVSGPAVETTSRFTSWPTIGDGDTGAYAVLDGGDISAERGTNTVYLATLPPDVQRGDLVRVHAHCLTHGEYVDFIKVS